MWRLEYGVRCWWSMAREMVVEVGSVVIACYVVVSGSG